NWFWDQEIFDFVSLHLHLIVQHSLRTYGQASELKQAGLDWKRAVLSRCLSGPALLVARLQSDPTFASEAARVQAFIAAGGGCRATYYHYARKLQPPADVPRIVLTNKTPPQMDTATPDHLDDLPRRYGRRPLRLPRRRGLLVRHPLSSWRATSDIRRRPSFRYTETPVMAASPKPPPHALHLSTYAELEAYVRAFA